MTDSTSQHPLQDRASERVATLRDEIRRHNRLYFVLDQPEVSDVEYDALFRELQQLEADFPELSSADSPTRTVGASPRQALSELALSGPAFAEVRHRIPMLSLGNAFNAAELSAWHQRAANLLDHDEWRFVSEPKIDGLAIALVYEHGQLVQAATRGDGRTGEDVTANVRAIDAVPNELCGDPPPLFEARGEIYMPKSGFEAMNAEIAARNEERLSEGRAIQKLYANPRNAAAGSVRQKDASVTASRPLSIGVYQLGWIDEGIAPPTHWETLGWLSELGLPTTPDASRHDSIDDALAACERWTIQRDAQAFEMDGVVVKVDDLGLQADLGIVGREPRWAIAWKFPPQEVLTVLEQILVNVGRTGSINPYARLRPVRVGGVEVTNATLHNLDDIRRKDIRERDTVIVRRAGDVIPQVAHPVLELRPEDSVEWEMPSVCPGTTCGERDCSNERCGGPQGTKDKCEGVWCGGAVSQREDDVDFYCGNRSCAAIVQRAIEHFAARGAMDIRGLGVKLIQLLLREHKINDVADLYTLPQRLDELAQIPGLGQIKRRKGEDVYEIGDRLRNLAGAIERSKSRGLAHLLVGLGIRHVGGENASLLADEFGSLDAILLAPHERLAAIDGVGPTIAESIVSWALDGENWSLVHRLQAAGVEDEIERSTAKPSATPLEGQRFVITGRFEAIPRPQAAAELKALGATIGSSVSRNTTAIFAGEQAGSKRSKAELLGLPIGGEEQLLAALNDPGSVSAWLAETAAACASAPSPSVDIDQEK